MYAREFDNLESAISCICQIENIWEVTEKLEEKINPDSNDICASAIIYNQWENMLDVEMYSGKWRLSGISEYTYEWRENIIKNKDIGRYSQCLVTYVPFFSEVDEDEFISKERVLEFISKWLETDDMSADFDRDRRLAYMKEIWG